jgi:hypothetical protein
MKVCSRCKVDKEASEFAVKIKRTGQLQSLCNPCKLQYGKEHYAKNKASYIQNNEIRRVAYLTEFYAFLKTQSCMDCGVTDFRLLEFDHLRDKSYNISEKVASTPLKTLMKEIEKCEVVCANCHRLRTAARGDYYNYLCDVPT